MSRAGFVLVGGKSSRMGRDKALLPFRGATLVEHVARAVAAAAAGSVTLVGNPEAYCHLIYPVIPDATIGAGPLAGIQAALASSDAEWNLIVACDMPAVSSGFLSDLMETAENSAADCLIPAGPSGLVEPLCAAYHRRCLPAITQALERGVRKVTDGLAGLNVRRWPVPESLWFQNLNTPRDWAACRHE
jgi:molybdopterin-guanine dinucleotide biosynthesis protein A